MGYNIILTQRQSGVQIFRGLRRGRGCANILQGLSNITVPLPPPTFPLLHLPIQSLTITVDNVTVSTLLPSPPPTLTAGSLLVVGGINDTSSVLVAERFRGCFDSPSIEDQ